MDGPAPDALAPDEVFVLAPRPEEVTAPNALTPVEVFDLVPRPREVSAPDALAPVEVLVLDPRPREVTAPEARAPAEVLLAVPDAPGNGSAPDLCASAEVVEPRLRDSRSEGSSSRGCFRFDCVLS